MVDCESLHARLLEADPEALSGAVDTPLGRHLAECPSCRRAAERVLAGQRALATALGSMQPTTPPPSVVALAARRSRRRWWWPPVAAAAVIALVWTGSTLRHRGRLTPLAQSTEVRPRPLVAASQNTVLIRTDNPDITIVWFY